MRQIQIILLIFIVANIFSQPILQQDPYLKFDHLTKKDGLSNNHILDIYQDKRGFVWIATIDGLNRYNAYDFEVFRNNSTDSLSISGSLITSIAEDIFGNLWFGTKTGLNKYTYETKGFHRYYHDDDDINTLSDNFVRDLYADANGILWIETSDGTLHKYDIANDSLTKYKHSAPFMINTYFYHKIFEDKNGYLWLGGRNMGIIKFDPVSCLFHEIIHDTKDTTKKRERDVTNYFIDSSGTYWISGIDGLYTFNIDKETFNKILPISTFSVEEDSKGILWFGTGAGVYAYDKKVKRFTKYLHSENNPNSLIADDISKIMIDKSGNIWVGTNDGISIHSPTKNKFKHIYHIPVNENTPISNYITTILQDKKGNIWLGTDNNGIDCFDENFNKITHYGCKEQSDHKLTSDKISVLMEDTGGDIWAGLWSGRGFNIIDPVTNKIDSYSKETNSLKVDWYNDIIEDSHSNYWVGIWGGVGLHQFDKENGVFKDETFALLNASITSPVLDMIIDNKSVWIATSKSCFPAFDITKGKYNLYFTENSMWLEGLQTNHIFLDKENELWYATNKGLYKKIQNPYIYFKHYLHNSRDKLINSNDNLLAIANSSNKNLLWIATINSIELFNKRTKLFTKVCDLHLKGDKINFIFEDANNHLWIGTQSGLYLKKSMKKGIIKLEKFPFVFEDQIQLSANCYLNEDTNNFWVGTSSGIYYYDYTEQMFIKGNELANYEIFSLSADGSSSMWVGTNNGLYNIKQDKIVASFTYSDSNNNTLAGSSIFSLGFDDHGNLWIGTNRGLCELKTTTGKITRYNKQQDSYLSSHLVSCIYEDKQGNIWIGTTNKGLNKIEASTGKIIQYKSNLQDSTAYWGNNIASVFQDKDGTIWSGGFGLNKYNSENETFTHYTEMNGLVDNEIMGILEDNSGMLWISTKNGLSKFDPQTENFENFFEKDGLQDNEFTQARTNFNNDLLIFGGKNGLTIFNPENISKNLKQPPTTISKFLIFDKETNYRFSNNNAIELKHNQNYFSFEFAALDFSFPIENKYAYKLESFDKDWIYTDAENRRAKYTNVPPGDYIFMVKASNNDGVWNETGTEVELIINPPFWKTIWFYFLEILLLVIAFVAYIKYREKNIKEKNKLLLLEQKLLRSQMNPHFIFNSLTSIQSFIFENNPIEAGSYLSKFSDLIRSILYNSREEHISLEKEISTLKNYLEIQQLRYNNNFDYKIEVASNIDTEMIAVPPMLAQPFIENSVEHGIRQIDRRGFIYVKFSLTDKSIFLTIEDNGIGIGTSKKIKNKKANEHKSLAIIITKERIEILNKKKKKSCTMHIGDIVGESGETLGTRVKFVIPYLIL